MTVQLIQFCSSLQLLQSFFQNIALKGYLTQRWMATTAPILQKKLSYEVYIYSTLWATKKWNVHFDLSLKLSKGRCMPFQVTVEVQKFPREMQNDLRGGAHLPSKSAMASSATQLVLSTACLWNLHSLREILLLVLCNAGLQISAGHRTLSGQFLHFVRSKLFMIGHVTGPICAGQVSNLKKLFI
jgi:hypothetical protein